MKTWRRGEIYHQHESSPSVGPDLGPNLWGQLLCSSLLFGLLLSHRHFQRKLHRIINSGGSFHQERSGNVADEIHTQFVDHFSAIQPIRDVARLERSEDVNNLGSVTKSADHLATHEIDIASSGSIPKSKVEEAVDDEDFPAWAAEFELPDYYTTRKKSWEDDWWSSVQNRDDAETFRHKFHLDVHKHNIVTEGRRQKLLQKSQCDQGHSESLWGVEYVLDDHFDIPSVKYWNEIHETPIDFRWKNIKSRNRSSYASPAHNIDKHTVWYLEYHYEPHADCLIHYPETDTDESDAENESDNAYAEDYKDQGHDHCFLDSVRDDKDDDHFSIQDDWEEF